VVLVPLKSARISAWQRSFLGVIDVALAEQPAKLAVRTARLPQGVNFQRKLPNVTLNLVGILVGFPQQPQRLAPAPQDDTDDGLARRIADGRGFSTNAGISTGHGFLVMPSQSG
jgi:hypothetical protein